MYDPGQTALAEAPDAIVEACQAMGAGDCKPIPPRLLQVLVVEDHRDSADTLGMLLQMWGHEARVAYSGAAALDLLATYQPDVMLLDVAMPNMDGYQLVRQLRRQPCFKNTLLIAITGYADEAHCLRGAAAGFDQYLVKPLEPETLEYLLRGAQRRLATAPATGLSGVPSETRSL